MNNFSGISFKVSPDLKRMSHAQVNSKKASAKTKRENAEKEEEESKHRGRSSSSSFNISQNSNLNIKNVTNLQMNDSFINHQTVNNHILNIKNMERELDRLMDKLIINLRERKVNSSPCHNFGLNFDNVFKTNTSQIIKVKAVLINSEEKKNSISPIIPISSLIPDCEKKLDFNKDKEEIKCKKRNFLKFCFF
jgi:hypothetical protein